MTTPTGSGGSESTSVNVGDLGFEDLNLPPEAQQRVKEALRQALEQELRQAPGARSNFFADGSVMG